MNRRNVLVGLGVIVVMSGVLLGTGAFSTVEADRSVTVTTEGDGSALVGFNATSEYASINDQGELELELNNATVNATITVNKAFEIKNNHNEEVTLNVSDSWTASGDNIDVTLNPASDSVSANSSVGVEMVVDTHGASKDIELNDTITIRVDN